MKTIILAGGSGTRLWPLSREYYPKQFLKLGDASLFQKTVERCLRISDLPEIFVVTNENQKFFVLGQMEELGLDFQNENLLIEPEGRNTLPAIYFGVNEMKKRFGKCVVAVFSSDHIMDIEAMDAIAGAEQLALGYIVTFGIVPKSPHTGYGYIRPGDTVGMGYKVAEFKEKPDLEEAKQYVENGYLWNSGMFLLDTDVFSSEVAKYSPDVYEMFRMNRDINKIYQNLPAISIDYGILEKSDLVAVVKLDFAWSDVGNFDAMYHEFDKDGSGNVVFGCDDESVDSTGNLIQSSQNKVVSLIGVDNMVVVDTPDALLVCPRDRCQSVKDVVNALKERDDERVSLHRTVYRPWGSYTILEDWERYKIKRIRVLQGKSLSLQLHYHRSEHWVVVTGTACVQVDGERFYLRQGESTFIKPGIKHRLSNPGKFALEIIEVQLGEYVGEDDIVRYDDEYGRE
ncbi:MAG: mannose-1-phosphate guanylyltransferase/mannose-6-phosphate isomerase [ANME-2 cluster archaeon]|nr:mannose-1-phosphate guanylyltransferase/mannose-6-phosphate isomerase [ANME-2 cluster archaeon]